MKIYRLGAGATVVRYPNGDTPGGMAFQILSGENHRTRLRGGVVISHWAAAVNMRDGDTMVDTCRREAERLAPFVLASHKYRDPRFIGG